MLTIAEFRKKIDRRRRTQGLTHVSKLVTLKRINSEPYGVSLQVSIFSAPEAWLQVAKSCAAFARVEINHNVVEIAEDSLESQKLSIHFIPIEGEYGA
jgi:hypothetical protein